MVNINPLTAPPPKEVPLKDAPLIRVIAQVRFPAILSIGNQAFVGSFQEAIRENYPILQAEQTQSFAFSPQGLVPTAPQVTWRFSDTADSWNWRVSLSPSFMALETTAYLSRHDFLSRLEKILLALNESFKPANVERFGLRYIDRIIGEDLQDISSLVKPELAGLMAASFKEYIHRTINESLFIIPDGGEQITARWGTMPAGETFDPEAIEAIDHLSWILDLDMSGTPNQDFRVEELISQAQRFSERIYTFFRWAVQDDFLRRYGGQI